MGSMVLDFLKGAERVTTHVLYKKPLNVGQEPLVTQPVLLGEARQTLTHSILTTFTHQFDDHTDLEDERLASVFKEVVLENDGVIRIQDRKQRIAIVNEAAGESLSRLNTMPIVIPLASEKGNAGMKEAETVFRTLVPFPRVRKFLEYWQENLDGPIVEVKIAAGSIARANWQNMRYEGKLIQSP